ncbi:hypothetical protein O3M35_001635 [Rhynocoris fuscipes]|uniref:SCD domain-containing protein n=1 Tax=Rhynocoris fuscipes TaxID=488301 RepID=A0AAW1CVR5_9HEMI
MDEEVFDFSHTEEPERPLENVNETEVVNNNPENDQVISESILLTVLNKENADFMVFIDEWLKTYENCSFEGIKQIIELIYHSTGWLSFVYDSSGLDEQLIKTFVNKKERESMADDPSSLNMIFLDRFQCFFTKLLELNDYQLLLTESFVSPLITSCVLLMSGKWTSFRMIAVTTGMKLMTGLHVLNERCITEIGDSTISRKRQSQLKMKKDYIFKKWFKLFNEVFSLSFRDTITEVRNVSLKEMKIWASNIPLLLLGRKWKNYIYIGLRDTNFSNREVAYSIVSSLFDKEINAAKQKDLFNYLKMELLYTLNFNKGKELSVAVSISVFYNIDTYVNIEMNKNEWAIIYLSVYNESQLVAFKAAKFVMKKLNKTLSTVKDIPAWLIKGLIIFCDETKVKANSLLMDVMYYYLRDRLQWQDWFKFISCCTSNETDAVVSLFYAYVLKALTDYTPPFRTKSKELKINKPKMLSDQLRFTKYLQLYWINIINMDKVKCRLECYAKMIKILQYSTMSLSAEINIEICKILSNIICTNGDKKVVSESCRSLKYLLTILPDTSKTESANIFNDMVNKITTEFLEYIRIPICTLDANQIHNRIILLCQNFDFDDDIIWETARENLMNARANRFSDELIIALMTIIHQRFFIYYPKEVLMNKNVNNTSASIEQNGSLADDESSNQEDNLENSNSVEDNNVTNNDKLLVRSLRIHNVIKPFLDESFSHSVKFTAFRIMCALTEYIGPHLRDQEALMELTTNQRPEIIKLMENIVLDAFAEECPNEKILDPTKRNKEVDCCITVNSFCSLLARGILDWRYSTNLILKINESHGHEEYLGNAFNKFVKDRPSAYVPPCTYIYNAIATKIKLELINGLDEEKAVESSEGILVKLLTLIAGKNHKSRGFRSILLTLYTIIIRQAFSASGVRSLLKLLYSLDNFLLSEDVPYLKKILNDHKELSKEIIDYSTFIDKKRGTS